MPSAGSLVANGLDCGLAIVDAAGGEDVDAHDLQLGERVKLR
jgi:hypothetical protein